MLELRRDLSIFEYTFAVAHNISNFFNKAKNIQSKLFEVFDQTKSLNTNSLVQAINKEVSGKNELVFENKTKQRGIFSEKFHLLPSKKIKNIENYSGIIEISGIKCNVQLQSKMNKYHNISCLVDSKLLRLTVDKNLNELLCTSDSYKETLSTSIFPYLWLNILKGEYSLCYSNKFEAFEKYYALKIKGLGLVTLKFAIIDYKLIIEVPYSNTSIEIDIIKLKSEIDNSNNPSANFRSDLLTKYFPALKALLKKTLICNKHQFLWIDSGNPFEYKEKSSTFLNSDFLFATFQNYMRRVFKFYIRVNGKSFNVAGYDNMEVRISHQKQRIVLDKKSPEFVWLFNLQSDKILFCPTTLAKSLELRFLLFKLFKY